MRRWLAWLAAFWLAVAPASADNLTLMNVSGGGVAGFPGTTWNPGAASINFTLTNGNLTATVSNGGVWSSVLSTSPVSAGKYYSEQTIVAISGSGTANWAIGIGDASASLASYAGSDSNSLGYFPNNGEVFFNGGNPSGTPIELGVQGQIVRMAVDVTGENIWFAINGGNWNNSGTANPATGAGGISFAGIANGTISAMFSGGTPGSVTSNFGASAFVYAPPTGYVAGP